MSTKPDSPKSARRDDPFARLKRSLESDREHGLTIPQWVAVLAAFDPRSYGDRPRPAEPTGVPCGPQRVKVYSSRLERGEDLYHPEDANALDENPLSAEAHLGVQAVRGKRQGGILVEGFDEPDEDPDEFIELTIPDRRAGKGGKKKRKKRA